MLGLAAPFRYLSDQAPRMLRELREFVRFPSVSAQPAHAPDLEACAGWLADRLRDAGLRSVRLVRHGGPPLVYGQWLERPDRPTLLIYGHYDVQPADPESHWERPPFAAQVDGDHLYGRGSSDDKGQMFAHVKALESCLRSEGTLPVNVICLFEGEEETGSRHLAPWLQKVAPALAIDAAVLSDTRMSAPGRPALTYSLRGSLDMELVVSRRTPEVHSGHFGGIAPDPVQALCGIAARLCDQQGRIAIPHFYQRVRRWESAERRYMRRVGPSDRELLAALEVRDSQTLVGEPGYTGYERVSIRPSLTVTGISGGYGGPGRKNAVANRALARLSFRLVDDQRPDEIEALLRRQVEAIPSPGLTTNLRRLSGSLPVHLDRNHPFLRLAAEAYRIGFGAEPALLRSGGTVPVVAWLRDKLEVPVVLMGFALPDDRMHAVNERMHIPGFFRGIATSTAFMQLLGSSQHARKRPLLRREAEKAESEVLHE